MYSLASEVARTDSAGTICAAILLPVPNCLRSKERNSGGRDFPLSNLNGNLAPPPLAAEGGPEEASLGEGAREARDHVNDCLLAMSSRLSVLAHV